MKITAHAAFLAAATPALATISCPSQNQTIFTNTNGDTYLVECGIDHSGGDMPKNGKYVASLDACIGLCSSTDDCVDVSWVAGVPQGACYLKSTVGEASKKSSVWGGKLLAKAPVVSTSVSIITSTVSSSTITSTSVVVTTLSSASVLPTGPSTPFCPNQNGTQYIDSCGAVYVIECGIDHSGGDLSGAMQYTTGLDKCMALCSSNSNCVDVSWVKGGPSGACYPKSVLGSANKNSAVWGARQISACALAFSSPSTSPTSGSNSASANSSGSLPISGSASPNGSSNSSSVSVSPSSSSSSISISGSNSSAPSTSSPSASLSNNANATVISSGLISDTVFPTPSTSASVSTNATISSSPTVSASPSNSVDATISSFSTVTGTASAPISNSANSTSSFSTPTTCSISPTYTAGALSNCVRCEGQPGTDQFCGYDINSNYYEVTPKTCNVVTFELEITNTTISPDGIERIGLVVNGQFPGPAIKASWGDTVVVTVKNSLQNNGTSIHFHGLRQLNNNMNDGVPSITQCPIAPGESMTYNWVASQYGSSWYHSHFAIQAWEGVVGPIIIDGPTSAPFDVDLGAYLLSDWTHATVDSMYDLAQNATPIPGATNGATFGGPQTMDNGLINGKNTWNNNGALNVTAGSRLEAATFTSGKSYLLRLVNTAIQSTFAFSIDGHSMTVISTDFVPIEPYVTNVLHINIGQRYNIIVHANASAGNYWMRLDNQQACTNMIQNRDVKAIVRYDGTSTVDPTSTGYNYTDACVDEPYASLVPVVALNAGNADFTEGALDVVIQGNSAQLYKWYLSGSTFFSEYSNPTLLDIYQNNSVPNYSGNLLVELPNPNEMVYVIIESPIPLPHPLHLHGHDFWVLAEGDGTYDSSVSLNLVNPPRRDVTLLPAAGYIVLAFVADNPGVWLLHCHIGWHTSMGFALQFVEQQSNIANSGSLNNSCTLVDTCNSWSVYANANDIVVEDSGV